MKRKGRRRSEKEKNARQTKKQLVYREWNKVNEGKHEEARMRRRMNAICSVPLGRQGVYQKGRLTAEMIDSLSLTQTNTHSHRKHIIMMKKDLNVKIKDHPSDSRYYESFSLCHSLPSLPFHSDRISSVKLIRNVLTLSYTHTYNS